MAKYEHIVHSDDELDIVALSYIKPHRAKTSESKIIFKAVFSKDYIVNSVIPSLWKDKSVVVKNLFFNKQLGIDDLSNITEKAWYNSSFYGAGAGISDAYYSASVPKIEWTGVRYIGTGPGMRINARLQYNHNDNKVEESNNADPKAGIKHMVDNGVPYTADDLKKMFGTEGDGKVEFKNAVAVISTMLYNQNNQGMPPMNFLKQIENKLLIDYGQHITPQEAIQFVRDNGYSPMLDRTKLHGYIDAGTIDRNDLAGMLSKNIISEDDYLYMLQYLPIDTDNADPKDGQKKVFAQLPMDQNKQRSFLQYMKNRQVYPNQQEPPMVRRVAPDLDLQRRIENYKSLIQKGMNHSEAFAEITREKDLTTEQLIRLRSLCGGGYYDKGWYAKAKKEGINKFSIYDYLRDPNTSHRFATHSHALKHIKNEIKRHGIATVLDNMANNDISYDNLWRVLGISNATLMHKNSNNLTKRIVADKIYDILDVIHDE